MTTSYLVPDTAQDEGLRLRAYPDPDSDLGQACERRGLDMSNYGCVPNWQALSGAPWTIGYGHTGAEVHEGLVWTQAQALQALQQDLAAAEHWLDGHLAWWRQMSDVRQDVFAMCVFNMGPTRFLKFQGAIGAAKRGDFAAAGWNLLWDAPGKPTPWSHEVGARATRLADQLELGRRMTP